MEGGDWKKGGSAERKLSVEISIISSGDVRTTTIPSSPDGTGL